MYWWTKGQKCSWCDIETESPRVGGSKSAMMISGSEAEVSVPRGLIVCSQCHRARNGWPLDKEVIGLLKLGRILHDRFDIASGTIHKIDSGYNNIYISKAGSCIIAVEHETLDVSVRYNLKSHMYNVPTKEEILDISKEVMSSLKS